MLAPAGLGLLGALVPLVVLYILKVRRKKRTVGSTWLWQAAQRDLMARSPFKRLVVQLPLILQALALIALALAAGRPATRGKALTGNHVAIIIDTSASMAAIDPQAGKARIEIAKESAKELSYGLPPGADAMLIDAGRDARVALPPDRDTRRLRTAIDAVTARDVEGSLAEAVALAVSRLKQLSGDRSVVVLTDGNLAHPLAFEGAAVPVELIRVGQPIDNTAIVRLDVRSGRSPASDQEQVEAFLLVANYGAEPREVFVTMRQRNASDVLASRKVRIEPGVSEPVVLSFSPTPGDYGAGLVFDLSPRDAMPVDDVAYGRVPIGRKLPVVVAAKGEPSPWLVRALVSDPDAEVRTRALAEIGAGADVDRGALVVIQDACPTPIAGGDLLIVNPPAGPCFGAVVGERIEAPLITSWDHANQRLRFLTLDGVHIAAARLVETESKRQELIRTDRGVIAGDVSTSARTATLLGFDVGESNWPLKASFVLFVRNVMELARLHRSSGVSGPARAGTPLRVSVPGSVEQIEVRGPEGDPAELPARGGLAIVPEVARIGLYQITWGKPRPGSLLVPVNLVSSAESDLRKQPEAGSGEIIAVSAAGSAVESHREWNWVLALLVLVLIAFDVWYLTRRPRTVRLAAAAKPRLPVRRGVS
ncbi:MAG: BatA and WFA domain-containing protein [Deltaproteobacteria bacterium]|jgi:hypothetical protein|nr:BatA and WFA domain-containing protein [Deltaproteobacteria bacterium]MBW2530450.1 BatA and WFA domain-containing protein [Deltaproteobacteria bacterium]